MPSDARMARALQALHAPREQFLSAVAAAVEEVRVFREASRPRADGAAEQAAVELGAFAAGRIDPARFAALRGPARRLEPADAIRVDAALAELTRVAAEGDSLFRARVEPGEVLRLVVGAALANAGRAFGAAQVVALIRDGRWHGGDHADLLRPFAFRRWNRAERQIAPALVVEVEGSDLHAGGLAEFLDGTQKIVLLVNPPAPPAALVGLLTPGVYVAQVADPAELDCLPKVAGPAVAAVMPPGAALFTHDPAGGRTLAERLSVRFLPAADELASLERYSAFRQAEELSQLRELAALPIGAPAAAAASEATVDCLAAWLLRQADAG